MTENRNSGTHRLSLWRLLDVLEKTIGIVSIASMTSVIFVGVIFRYVLKDPLGWTEEFTLICMMWCVFGSASYAFKKGLNVGVTFLVDRFPGKSQHIVRIMIYFATIAFMGVLFFTGWEMMMVVAGKYTNAAHIPLMVPYAAIPVGSAMSILRILKQIFDEKNLLNAKDAG